MSDILTEAFDTHAFANDRFGMRGGVLALVLSFACGAWAGSRPMDHVCGTDADAGYSYTWCIDKEQGSTNPDILYSYHGLNGSNETWVRDPYGIDVTKALEAIGDLPTVISFSFGNGWLVTDLPTADGKDSLESVIVSRIMPKLEARAGFKGHGRRLIIGISMGGFNAAQMSIKEPLLFDDTVLICPIAQTVGPFSSDADIASALARQNAGMDPGKYRGALQWMKDTFHDQPSWDRHNLLSLVHRLGPTSHPMYLTTGRQDDFGFFEGATIFAATASAQGAPLEWHPIDGHHCVWDAPSIAHHLYH